jgi:hypothetical protein
MMISFALEVEARWGTAVHSTSGLAAMRTFAEWTLAACLRDVAETELRAIFIKVGQLRWPIGKMWSEGF